MSAEQIVRNFFAAQATPGGLVASFETYLSEDCVWDNTGLPSCKGREACLGLLGGFTSGLGLHSIGVEYLEIAIGSNGGVITERVDRFFDKDGNQVGELAVAGTLVVRDDKIVHWRDYFDPSPFTAGA